MAIYKMLKLNIRRKGKPRLPVSKNKTTIVKKCSYLIKVGLLI